MTYLDVVVRIRRAQRLSRQSVIEARLHPENWVQAFGAHGATEVLIPSVAGARIHLYADESVPVDTIALKPRALCL